MNNNKNRKSPTPLQQQQGAVVIAVVLVLLVVLTMVGLTSAKKSSVETKMTTNTIDRQKSLIAARAAIKHAWKQLNDMGFNVTKYVSNCNQNGFYDLRTNAVSQCQAGLAKTNAVWTSLQTSTHQGWDNAQKRQQMTGTGIEATMNLTTAPQYTLGIRDAVERKGTEGSYCVPISIMGEGTGSTANAKSLVEVNAIPRSGCFRDLVQ